MKVWLVRYRTFIYQFNEAPDMDKFPFYEDVSEDMEKGLDYDDAFTANCGDWVSVLNVENFLELGKQKDETIRCIETGDPYENSSEEHNITAQDVRNYIVTASFSQLDKLGEPVNGINPIVALLNAFNTDYIIDCLYKCDIGPIIRAKLMYAQEKPNATKDLASLASHINGLKEEEVKDLTKSLTPKILNTLGKNAITTIGDIIDTFNKLTSSNVSYILERIEPRIIDIIVAGLKGKTISEQNFKLSSIADIDKFLKDCNLELLGKISKKLIDLYPAIVAYAISDKTTIQSNYWNVIIAALSNEAYRNLVTALASHNSVKLKEALPPFILTNPEEKEVPSILNSDKNNWLI